MLNFKISKLMKKNILNLIAMVGVLSLSSCSNDYLNNNPTDAIPTEDALGNTKNLTAVINGMHRQMYTRQNDQGTIGHTSSMIVADALCEDLVFPSISNNWFISMVNWEAQKSIDGIYGPFQFYYRQIHNANAIIQVEEDKKPLEKTKNYYKEYAFSQAYAFRAFSYFQLVQFYGGRYIPSVGGTPANNNQLGVSLRLKPTYEPIARSTVEEVYAQINKDLDLADLWYKQLLQESPTWTRDHKSHFDPNVITGLRARVALTQGKWDLAATQAKKAREAYPLMNNTEYMSGFNSLRNSEWIWGCEMIEAQNDGFGSFGAYMSRNFNSTNIRQSPKAINKLLFEAFPATDVRTKNFDVTGLHKSLKLPDNFTTKPYTSQKFLALDGTSRMDVPFMRSAEMYLIEAEALAKLGKIAESKVVFTELEKNRNPAYITTAKTGDAYIEDILNSRRIELWGEGFRYFDLKRLNRNMTRTYNPYTGVTSQATNISSDDTRWNFRLPLREIQNSNELVIQNP
jgi:starch-binding outer membrane protein, SusD/RagB family